MLKPCPSDRRFFARALGICLEPRALPGGRVVCLLRRWAYVLWLAGVCWAPAAAQEPGTRPWAGNLKFLGITFHPGGGEDHYPLALDSDSHIVFQLGLEGDLDYSLHRFLLLRFSTSLYLDCAVLWAGFFHFAPRLNLPMGRQFAFRIGIGPTVIWRQNWWDHVDWYDGDLFYGRQRTNGYIQTAFLWYGGNIEMEYRLRESLSLVYSVVPGFPLVFTNSFGIRRPF